GALGPVRPQCGGASSAGWGGVPAGGAPRPGSGVRLQNANHHALHDLPSPPRLEPTSNLWTFGQGSAAIIAIATRYLSAAELWSPEEGSRPRRAYRKRRFRSFPDPS